MSELVISQMLDDAVIATIHCRDINLSNRDALKTSLMEIADQASDKMIIDMKKMNYLDSSGIGIILSIMQKVQEKNGRFYLTGINQTISTVLHMSKIGRVLNLKNSIEEALQEK